MEGSVLSFLKAQWKVNDTDSANWACIVVLFSFGRCVVCQSLIYIFKLFWLPHCYLQTLLITSLLSSSSSDYSFVIFKLFWLPLCYLQTLLITPLLSSSSSDYPFVIFKLFLLPLCYLQTLLTTPLLSSNSSDYPFVIFKLFLQLPFYVCQFVDLSQVK
jgi:hypothetical protein